MDLPILTFLTKYCKIALTGPKLKEKIVSLNAKPSCPFLNNDDLCSIYRVRPQSCRLYPAAPNSFSIIAYPECSGFDDGEYMTIEDIEAEIERIEFHKGLAQMYTQSVKYGRERRIEVRIDI